MIIDHIQHRDFYRQFGPRLARALEYLANTDFSKAPDGKHDIESPHMFALVQRYKPRPVDKIAWEAHRRYIDVQYIAVGTERMGYAPLREHIAVREAYDPERDVAFFDANGDLFTVSAGFFVVFAPWDVHAPGLAPEDSIAAGQVLKVVVKMEGGL
jgi:YhcH/YjgK/YiaL family protein